LLLSINNTKKENKKMKLNKISKKLLSFLFALCLNSSVIYFEINTNLDRPSVEFGASEKSCSKDTTFKICGNVRLRSTKAISTRRARIIYLGISRGIKRVRKVISKKKSRK
jgi:hypothetical protein